MAIVKLSKLKLYGMNEEKNKIIDMLYKSKLVHVESVKNISGLKNYYNENESLEYLASMKKVQNVIDFYV